MKTAISKERKSYEAFLKHLDFVRENTEAGLNAFESKEERDTRVKYLLNNYGKFFEYYFPHYCTDEEGVFSACADFHVEFARIIKQQKKAKELQRWGRGLAKSVHSCMGIPIFLWAGGEKIFEAVIGNSENSALRLLDDVRAEFTSNERLIRDFGKQHLLGQWEAGEFVTKDGNFMGKALGMGQNVRGLRVGPRRPNYCVADDLEDAKTVKNPVRQNEIAEWILRSLIPMMVGPVRRFICANNFFAPQTIQSLLHKKRPKWGLHRVDACNSVTFEPAWPERDTKEKYKAIAEEIGILPFLSEFCNQPHIEGSIFLTKDIVYLSPALMPKPHEMEMTFAYWDVAYGGTEGSDFNALTVWGVKEKKYYHLASFCKQSKMEVALEWLAEFISKRRTEKPMHCYYESQFWNDSVKASIAAVEKRTSVSFNFYKHQQPKSAKYDRILSLQPSFQRSELFFKEADRADPDVQIGLSQLYGIEPGYKSHDDWPDALEAVIKLLQYHTKTSEWGAPITGRGRSNNVW